jgi:segregation and condensation protein A
MEEYRVNLEVFAGPLDLLLYLVRKEEVDIYDIPIARITAQYIHYIEMMKDMDIDLAGDFLVLAATLMEIKSAMLLPRTDTESGEVTDIQDPRAELVRQLLEYKRIKDLANLLADAADQRQQRFTRPDAILSSLKKNDEPEVDLDQVSIWTLLEAFDSILKATGHVSSYSHIADETPIDLYQIEILHRLQTEGPMTFEKIFQDRTDQLVMIGLFLATLELIRDQLISVEQTEIKGQIYIKAITAVPAEQAVQEAMYSRQKTEQQEAIEHEKAAAEEVLETQEVQKESANKFETGSRPWVSKEYEYEFDEDDELAAQLKAIEVSTAGEMPQAKDETIERPKDHTQLESPVQTQGEEPAQPDEVLVQSEPEVQTQTQPVAQAPSEPQTESKPKRKRPRISIQEIPAVPDKSTLPIKPSTVESAQSE